MKETRGQVKWCKCRLPIKILGFNHRFRLNAISLKGLSKYYLEAYLVIYTEACYGYSVG